MNSHSLLALFFIATVATNTWAAGPFDAKMEIRLARLDDSRCKKEVEKYMDAVQFVSQSAGDEVGAKVMNHYVPVGLLHQIISSNGYCAGVQLLREKRALR